MNKQIISVDADTGEQLPGRLVWIPDGKRHQNAFPKGDWFAMSQSNGLKHIRQHIKGQALTVLLHILETIDFENYIRIDQTAIAKENNIHKSDVSKHIKLLTEHKILIAGPRAGRSYTYRLNPAMGWKGKGENHRKALSERIREKWGTDGDAIVDTKTVDWIDGKPHA